MQRGVDLATVWRHAGDGHGRGRDGAARGSGGCSEARWERQHRVQDHEVVGGLVGRVSAHDEPVSAGRGLRWEPLHGERRPLERVGDDEVVKHRRVLLPVPVLLHLRRGRGRRRLGARQCGGSAVHGYFDLLLCVAREAEAACCSSPANRDLGRSGGWVGKERAFNAD